MHRISEVRRELGALEWTAGIAGVERGMWLRSDEPVMPRGDAVLPASLLLAMTTGGTLELPGTIDPKMLRGTEEIQAVFAHWSQDWPFTDRPLLPVEVRTGAGPDWSVPPGDRVGAFFSGGVDSFATVLARPEVTDLIFVAGLDIPLSDPDRLARVERHLRAAASELGRHFIRVDTNLRVLSEPLLRWEVYYGAALATVATVLAGRFARIHMAGWENYANLRPGGSHPLVDHLWAPAGLELFHDGARYNRAERVALMAHHPVARRRLRVCWQNADGTDLNCGTCHKCLCTMVPLSALRVLDRFETFPPLDLDRLAALRVTDPLATAGFWQGNLSLAEAQRAPKALIAAIEQVMSTIGEPPPPRRRRAFRRR
jgi:hypothetical protein